MTGQEAIARRIRAMVALDLEVDPAVGYADLDDEFGAALAHDPPRLAALVDRIGADLGRTPPLAPADGRQILSLRGLIDLFSG